MEAETSSVSLFDWSSKKKYQRGEIDQMYTIVSKARQFVAIEQGDYKRQNPNHKAG